MFEYGHEAAVITPVTTDLCCVIMVEKADYYDKTFREYEVWGYYDGAVVELTSLIDSVPDLLQGMVDKLTGNRPGEFDDYISNKNDEPGIAMRAVAKF